ncbi:MAG: peptidoglycan DD-metalloendopeptidase family protein [Rhodoferax sp.]|nr:peptidoglycan DD-metalloendopeptidase family protein [Rhodoferax sp.]
MMGFRAGCTGLLLGVVLVLVGCGGPSLTRAPVEDRTLPGTGPAPVDARAGATKQPPGFENAGKPGYYTVKPGDTLIRIGLENGQSHKDLSRWNALENPNKIEVGQVIRVVPPAAATEPVSPKPIQAATSNTTVLPPAAALPAAAGVSGKGGTSAATAPVAPAPTTNASGDDAVAWIWPASGPVLSAFDESKNKGVDIGGSAGDAVVAAGEGKVVYAGAGLRGYGNLIILKHNNTYLTAYAHNQVLLVKEDQVVRKGQKIAEMGSSDADRTKLHFEVRKQGKPVDPLKILPAR